MVSLTAVEEIANRTWPGHLHAALAVSDSRKGERIILITAFQEAQRSDFARAAQTLGYSELHIPRDIFYAKEIPLLGSGKVDYPALALLLPTDESL